MAKKPVKWLILQLDEECCLEKNYSSIAFDLINNFGKNAKTYVPIHIEEVGDKILQTVLFDGYVFVCCQGVPDIEDRLNRLRSMYVRGPVIAATGIQYVNNTEIERYKKLMEKKLKEFIPTKNQKVIAKVGTYRNMEGTVVKVNRKELTAIIKFPMRSREVTDVLKLINLAPIDDEGSYER